MKKIRYIIASALVSIGLCACTDTLIALFQVGNGGKHGDSSGG